MKSGAATKQERAIKLSGEQLEHMKQHHVDFAIRDGRMEIYYKLRCKENPSCPVEGKEHELAVYVCPCPPCPKPT